MAHPFFGVITYPWHRPEAVRFHEMLFKAIAQPVQIDKIYKQCQENLPPLTVPASPSNMWYEALANLTAYNALKQLCDIIADQFKTNPEIQSAVSAVVEAQPAVKQRVISDSVVVLDRAALREQLALLESEDNPVKVVLVRGDPDSGKSHTRYLFERMAKDNGAIPVYLCQEIVATVDEVVSWLFGALDASDKIPSRNSTEDAWYRTVCLKLKEIASINKKPLWIAIDDLGRDPNGEQLMDPAIREFCNQFALNMMNPVFYKWFRLLLIDYPDGAVPARWKSDFWQEARTSLADIKLEHVVELLEIWRATYQYNIIDADLLNLAQTILAASDVPAAGNNAPYPPLRRIHDALTKTRSTLAPSKG
jgi:hypothetical protein